MSSHVCTLCQRHRPVKGDACGLCRSCRRQCDSTKRVPPAAPWRYLHWRGYVVAGRIVGTNTVRFEPVYRDIDALPKSRVINLDVYLPEYRPEQVKTMKRAILQTWNLAAPPPPLPEGNGKAKAKAKAKA